MVENLYIIELFQHTSRTRTSEDTKSLQDEIIKKITDSINKSDCEEMKNFYVTTADYEITFHFHMDHQRFLDNLNLFRPIDGLENQYLFKTCYDIQVKDGEQLEEGDVIYLSGFLEKADPGKQYEVNFETFRYQTYFSLVPIGKTYDCMYGFAEPFAVYDITKWGDLCEKLGIKWATYQDFYPGKGLEEVEGDCLRSLFDEDLDKLGDFFKLPKVDLNNSDSRDAFLTKLNEKLEEYDIAIIDSGSNYCFIDLLNSPYPLLDTDTSINYIFEACGKFIKVNHNSWLLACVGFDDSEDYIKINKIY